MPRLQRTGSAPLRARCRRVRSGRCRDRAVLHADRLELREGTWLRRRTTTIPLSAITHVEWWTEQHTFNLGLHRADEPPLFLYLEGAGRWKFAIDERLRRLGRDHSGMPRLRSGAVTPATRVRPSAPEAVHVSGDHAGDHLPAEVELALGDGSSRALSAVATRVAPAPPPSTARAAGSAAPEAPRLSLPLRAVRAIRWALRGDAVEMHLEYRDGAAATLTLDDDGEVRFDAEHTERVGEVPRR